MARYLVVGGGIVGLATARQLLRVVPAATVTVLEKERRWGSHQTGHNSGVIHAGVYYRPGSLKARLCRSGNASMVKFCRDQEIPVEVCGKLIVATDPDQLPRLHVLRQRAADNGLAVSLLDRRQAREYEPHLHCLAALHVPSTGIVDFATVSEALAGLLTRSGADLRPGVEVVGIRVGAREVVAETTAGPVTGDVLVNCAGLHSDRVARLAGLRPAIRIIPFRGDYHQLRKESRSLVQGLIYPVPDPRLPFLGVHLTRTIDGSVHAGPNAVLALSREGYRWRQIRLRDLAEVAGYPGTWRLARRHAGYGLSELRRSLSRRAFARELARLVPELSAADLQPASSGVRAQAVTPDGSLVDDFLIVTGPRQIHLLNAPSPAATSALEVANEIVARLPA